MWIVTNWLLYHGLLRYGYTQAAQSLAADSRALLETQGFREYFDPRDGTWGCTP